MAKAMTIPMHAMQAFVLQCIASGMTANTFGPKNGLTVGQTKRLATLVRQRGELATRRANAHGSIFSENHAQSLQLLSNRMVKAMMETGSRAVEQLERLNRRYTPVKRRGKMISRQIEGKDLPVYKFAWQTCERIVALSRKDGRDEPAIDPAAAMPMAEAVADRAPLPGMLTVIPAGGGDEVRISE